MKNGVVARGAWGNAPVTALCSKVTLLGGPAVAGAGTAGSKSENREIFFFPGVPAGEINGDHPVWGAECPGAGAAPTGFCG